MQPATAISADKALLSLEALLDAERAALRVLDSVRVERIAEQKLEVEKQLRSLMEQGHRPSDASLVRRVHQKTQDNQVLLVHARNCVRSVVDTLTGAPERTYESNPPPANRAVRLDLKG